MFDEKRKVERVGGKVVRVRGHRPGRIFRFGGQQDERIVCRLSQILQVHFAVFLSDAFDALNLLFQTLQVVTVQTVPVLNLQDLQIALQSHYFLFLLLDGLIFFFDISLDSDIASRVYLFLHGSLLE